MVLLEKDREHLRSSMECSFLVELVNSAFYAHFNILFEIRNDFVENLKL